MRKWAFGGYMPQPEKMYLMTCAPSEDSDLSVYPCLIQSSLGVLWIAKDRRYSSIGDSKEADLAPGYKTFQLS